MMRRSANCIHWLQSLVYRFWIGRDGNLAIIFALLAVPMIAAVGAGLDFSNAYNTKTKLQYDLDAALLVAVRESGSADEDTIKTQIAAWFAAQTDLTSSLEVTDDTATSTSTYLLNADDIVIDATNHTITATVTASVPTFLMQIIGVYDIDVTAESSVTGSATDYINVYIVLDKSASMLLAATSAGQTTMVSKVNCVFACHTGTYYSTAVANSVTLRADVQLTAVKTVLSLINSANSAKNHVKAGLYTLGTSTTGTSLLSSSYKTANGIHTVQSPIYTYSTLVGLLSSSSELSSSTSYDSTDFRALDDLADIVGAQGDGSSESSPLKIVMLITDGVQSSKGFITNDNYHPYIVPMNPSWCADIKTNGATMAVLYTEYLAVTKGGSVDDYKSSIGAKMSTSYFSSKWSGSSSYLTTAIRRDKIETMLTACASSEDYFISAASETAITSGFASLLTTYLSAVRLTN